MGFFLEKNNTRLQVLSAVLSKIMNAEKCMYIVITF